MSTESLSTEAYAHYYSHYMKCIICVVKSNLITRCGMCVCSVCWLIHTCGTEMKSVPIFEMLILISNTFGNELAATDVNAIQFNVFINFEVAPKMRGDGLSQPYTIKHIVHLFYASL